MGKGLWTWWLLWILYKILNFLSVVRHWNHVTFSAPESSHNVGGRVMILWVLPRNDHSIWHCGVTHRLLKDIEGQPHAFLMIWWGPYPVCKWKTPNLHISPPLLFCGSHLILSNWLISPDTSRVVLGKGILAGFFPIFLARLPLCPCQVLLPVHFISSFLSLSP